MIKLNGILLFSKGQNILLITAGVTTEATGGVGRARQLQTGDFVHVELLEHRECVAVNFDENVL